MKKIHSSEITPEGLYRSRRRFINSALKISAASLLISSCSQQEEPEHTPSVESEEVLKTYSDEHGVPASRRPWLEQPFRRLQVYQPVLGRDRRRGNLWRGPRRRPNRRAGCDVVLRFDLIGRARAPCQTAGTSTASAATSGSFAAARSSRRTPITSR